MKFYVISYENGDVKYVEFTEYMDVLKYVETYNSNCDFTIEEYDSEKDYFNSL